MSALVNQTGRWSVFQAKKYWYVACLSSELKKKPIQVQLWDTPIVLFRDLEGKVQALLDRCSHRNVPLSDGKCINGRVQCPYHGWEFDGEGSCRKIPALVKELENSTRNVPSFPVRELQGHIWIFTSTESAPNHEPFLFPKMEDAGYTTIMYQADFNGSIHATAENILDVPHTAFLHKGLFRGGVQNKIQTKLSRFSDRVECQYIGEPRPSGLMGRILAPKGGEVEHYDRFLLPSIAQVEYGLGDRRIIVSNALSPISDFETRLYTVVTIKLKVWPWLLRPIVLPFALKVVDQDILMLEKQKKWIQRFGGEDYCYSDVDLLGASILRLLKKATTEAVAIQTEVGEPDSILNGELLA